MTKNIKKLIQLDYQQINQRNSALSMQFRYRICNALYDLLSSSTFHTPMNLDIGLFIHQLSFITFLCQAFARYCGKRESLSF